MAVILGYNAIETTDTFGGNYIEAMGPFSVAQGGTISTLLMYLNTGPAVSLTMGVYSETGGLPVTLLADTVAGAGQCGAGAGWYSRNLDAPLLVAPGTNYWLGGRITANRSFGIAYAAGACKRMYKVSTYIDGVLPAALSGLVSENEKGSIYGVVTPIAVPVILHSYRRRRAC